MSVGSEKKGSEVEELVEAKLLPSVFLLSLSCTDLGKLQKRQGRVSSAVWVEGVGWKGKRDLELTRLGIPMRTGFTGKLVPGRMGNEGSRHGSACVRGFKATCRFGGTMQSFWLVLGTSAWVPGGHPVKGTFCLLKH